MRSSKMASMVTEISRRKPVGRPRKYERGGETLHVVVPLDLLEAIDAHASRQRLPGRADALRDLLREAAEALQLVEPRPS